MPKDEFDVEDPLAFVPVGIMTEEDTTEAMADAFIEEFMWLGFQPGKIFDLFRQPFYAGMHMVFEKRGEDYVRNRIAHVFQQWQNPATTSTESKESIS